MATKYSPSFGTLVSVVVVAVVSVLVVAWNPSHHLHPAARYVPNLLMSISLCDNELAGSLALVFRSINVCIPLPASIYGFVVEVALADSERTG